MVSNFLLFRHLYKHGLLGRSSTEVEHLHGGSCMEGLFGISYHNMLFSVRYVCLCPFIVTEKWYVRPNRKIIFQSFAHRRLFLILQNFPTFTSLRSVLAVTHRSIKYSLSPWGGCQIPLPLTTNLSQSSHNNMTGSHNLFVTFAVVLQNGLGSRIVV